MCICFLTSLSRQRSEQHTTICTFTTILHHLFAKRCRNLQLDFDAESISITHIVRKSQPLPAVFSAVHRFSIVLRYLGGFLFQIMRGRGQFDVSNCWSTHCPVN